MNTQNHDFHLVNPSPWPIFGALSAMVLAAGALLFMHPNLLGNQYTDIIKSLGPWKILPGILMILFTMLAWWQDVVKEAHQGDHKPIVQIGLKYGMALFIASEVMFFVAFFWAFFDASLFFNEIKQYSRVEATGGTWPPQGIIAFKAFDLPFINTLILLLSGCTVTWAHHSVREGNRKGLTNALAITVILGLLFTTLQAFEYSHAQFGFTNGIYASTFFMATGFHGFHVIIGTIFLFVCYIRSIKGHFTPQQHIGLEAAAWYWHFVDVVWLFLFICVYWWGG